MADITNEKLYTISDFGGMQQATSRFSREKTDLSYAQNADYTEIGTIGKKLGMTQRGNALSSTTTTSTSTSTTTTSSSTSSSTTTTA